LLILKSHLVINFFRSETVKLFKSGLPAIRSNATSAIAQEQTLQAA